MLVPRAVDDETYRKVRMKAAERETSVSALIAEFLFSFTQPNAGRRERVAASSARVTRPPGARAYCHIGRARTVAALAI
jgi:hypothetical protein